MRITPGTTIATAATITIITTIIITTIIDVWVVSQAPVGLPAGAFFSRVAACS
jgi:hypothetical protein